MNKNLFALILSLLFSFNLAFTDLARANEHAPLEKAETAIKSYFDAILGDQSTLGPNMAMSQAIESVPEKDQSRLQDYYDKISLSAAKQTVDAYAHKVLAGQDSSDAADRMHEIEDALNPDTRQKIKLYYDQVLHKKG